MRIFWRNKFIFWNLIALIAIKAIFSFSSFQLASILDGVIPFSKEDIVSQTNVFRSDLGFTQLKSSPILDAAAQQKLQDMINSQYFAHTSPSGTSPWYWFETNSYKYTYAGENLAIGFVEAKSTVDAWANSPSHRANLLNPYYKEIGVAVAPASIQNNSGYLVVQLFGTPRPVAITATKPKISPTPIITPKPKPTVRAAQTSNPTIIPTPMTILTPAPVTAADLDGSQSETTTPTRVSVAAPTPPVLKDIARSLNVGLILYSFAAFLAFVVVMAFRGIRKDLAIRTAASFALLVLAIIVPVMETTRVAFIL